MPRTVAILVAAGSGHRLGGGVPKQYRSIGGRALIAHAIDTLAACEGIDAVLPVIGASQRPAFDAAIGTRAVLPPVTGGATRRESVAAGLAALPDGVERVLVHDAARPFLPVAVAAALLAALDRADGAVPALPVADTLARGDADMLGDIVPREAVHRIQTPQAFRLAALRTAHAGWDAVREATDDAQMLRAAGFEVALVAGSPRLNKITYEDDVMAAERQLLVSRSGLGFDVHALVHGDHVMLGGVRIAHDRALEGHSDADVALHALTDALLGTLGDGDIGSHFPPSEPRWRGAASDQFLAHARDLVAARGGVIDHADVTIICEAPKIGPHREAIRASIAAVLAVPLHRVSVKATTTERLGFTGRGEGIAAQAIATVRLPETDR